jgi:putative transposase
MSLPRPVIPNRVYLITRRCAQRQFLMRPDAATNQAFMYCLGVAAQRTNVKLLFVLAMSNHYHAGIVDTDGRLPEFLERFHRMFAKHQNVIRGRTENFWASEQTSVVTLEGEEDILDKLLYTLANPVASHLVATAGEWPGASSLDANRRHLKVAVERPPAFFSKRGAMPDQILLEFSRPPGFEKLSDADYTRLIDLGLREREAKAAEDRATRKFGVLGRAAILGQAWWEAPTTVEPRQDLRPRVAAKNVWRRIEAIRRNREFLEAYKAARERWLSGEPPCFPVGTYWLRRFAAVNCEALPAAA